MSDKPILVFPRTTRVARKTLQRPVFNLHKPDKSTQIGRLNRKFTDLIQKFQDRIVQVEASADGLNEDMVIVFELRGDVTNFFRAVRLIPELDWMGEYETSFLPDDDFYNEKKSNNQLVRTDSDVNGKIYFVMSNYSALTQIINLWERFQQTDNFPEGFAPWKNLFSQLYDLRLWNLTDRIQETGILEDIDFRLQQNQDIFPFELELWYRNDSAKRNLISERIRKILDIQEGEVISESVINEIGYHGMLVNAPIDFMRLLNVEDDVELFKVDDIMFLRPVGQCVFTVESEQESEDISSDNFPSPDQPPLVALLDGVPLQNHELIKDRIIVEDVNNYEATYPSDKRSHGTCMASIIIHGDKNAINTPIRSTLYVAPVMVHSTTLNGESVEQIPENKLTIDIIHEAVKNIFDNPELNKTIKVINLSLGDPSQPFNLRMSSWAKLIDWLSFKYTVLFTVSAGNCGDDIDFGLSSAEYSNLVRDRDELDKRIIQYLYTNARYRKILSPSESINAITVGATHEDDSSGYNSGFNVEVFSSSPLFSPTNRLGSGYRRSIKPDLVMPGGRIFFQDPAVRGRLVISKSTAAPGFLVASPRSTNATHYTRGTSNANALLTRSIAILNEKLLEDNIYNHIDPIYFPVLAKALLVHSSSWNSSCINKMTDSLNLSSNHHTEKKAILSRFFGYGKVMQDRIFSCTSHRVTALTCGELVNETAHQFNFPLPPSLSGKVVWRKLIVSLAWLSPVNSKSQLYRKAKLWFDFPEKNQETFLGVKSENYDHNAVNRGTIQHQIFFADRASAFTDGAAISIRVNCKEDASGFSESVKYALTVTLEVDDAIGIDIYNEVELRIRQQIRPSAAI